MIDPIIMGGIKLILYNYPSTTLNNTYFTEYFYKELGTPLF